MIVDELRALTAEALQKEADAERRRLETLHQRLEALLRRLVDAPGFVDTVYEWCRAAARRRRWSLVLEWHDEGDRTLHVCTQKSAEFVLDAVDIHHVVAKVFETDQRRALIAAVFSERLGLDVTVLLPNIVTISWALTLPT